MAKCLEDLEDKFEELELIVSSRFDGLKKFTFQMLKEADKRMESFEERLQDLESKSTSANLREEIEKLDDSIGSLRGEFEVLRSSASTPIHDESFRVNENRKQKTPPTEDPNAKTRAFKGFTFNPLRLSGATYSRASPKIPETLEDIEDDSLRRSVEKYYESSINSLSKLTPAQTAYFQYFMTEKLDGYTTKRSGIEHLISAGVKDGIWPMNFKPAGSKATFKEYLKEKVKNTQKKKLVEKAVNEFVDEFNMEK